MQTILKFKFLLLSILILTACNKKEDCYTAIGINGQWNWAKTVGGFAGSTKTPKTENQTETLVIDDFRFKRFVNDDLVLDSGYSLDVRQDSAFGTNVFIVFEDGSEKAVLIEKNKLELYDLCSDCFTYFYDRE